MVKYSIKILKQYIFKHWIFLSLFIILGILSVYFSHIDLKITSLFYKNNSFYLAENTFGLIIYEGAYYLTIILMISLLIMLIKNLITKQNVLNCNKKAILFIIFSFILAPGIVVNSILKDHVGRPRPAHVIEFGGTKEFQPPFVISNQCKSNCSFVSGHASFAYAFMVFGLLFTGLKRKSILILGFLFGSIVGFVRIYQGRHFFTDIVFAFFFTWLTITLLYEFLYPKDDLPKSIKPC